MASRAEIAAVYAAAVIQGIVLVTFPAVAPIFTSTEHYGLSTGQYGDMFAPQAVMAILASLLGAGLTRRIGGKMVLLVGLAADLLSMALLFASQFMTGDHALAYGSLLAATASLGVGFGFVVPALNTFTAAFFPNSVDRSILTLNALLGTGTALAPIFAAIFVGLGIWWGLPLLMSVLAVVLLLFSARLPLKEGTVPATIQTPAGLHLHQGIPARFWLYAAFALLYGVCETMNGNWASIYLTGNLRASTTLASFALTAFWIAVTGGRVLFAAIEKWMPERLVYRGLPLVILVAFLVTTWTTRDSAIVAVFSFALAGLGCSALLPLVISFGQGELKSMTTAVAGGMIGFYQIGYGLAAFGVGPLQRMGLTLGEIYRWSAGVALALAVLAFVIAGRRAAVTS